MRTFRFDRIQTVVDLDGVTYPALGFFRDELRVTLAPPAPEKKPPPKWETYVNSLQADVDAELKKPGGPHRTFARAGARVLAALAKSDGVMDAAEVNIIIDYMAEYVADRGYETSAEDRKVLAGHVKRLRPTATTLYYAFKYDLGDERETERLFRFAEKLIDADGTRSDAEVAMLTDLRRNVSEQDRRR